MAKPGVERSYTPYTSGGREFEWRIAELRLIVERDSDNFAANRSRTRVSEEWGEQLFADPNSSVPFKSRWRAGAAVDPICAGFSFGRIQPIAARIGSRSRRSNMSPAEEWLQGPGRREWPGRQSRHSPGSSPVGAFAIRRDEDRSPPARVRPRIVPQNVPERAARAASRCSHAVLEERRA
jgi:hypothetical protein